MPLHDILCVPNLTNDIVSAGRLSQMYDIYIKGDRFYISEKSEELPKNIVGTGTRRNNVYRFDSYPNLNTNPRTNRLIYNSMRQLHSIFAHRNTPAIRRIITDNPVDKVLITSDKGTCTCNPCNQAKRTRTPHRISDKEHNIRPLEKLSTDTAGPMIRSTRGNTYFSAIVDKSD